MKLLFDYVSMYKCVCERQSERELGYSVKRSIYSVL